MPLKHFTETFLVIVLGAVIALTGLLIATLPSLPEGGLPWAVLFVLAIIYPLTLLPMFRLRRADTFFRNLHWFPALMLLAWLVVEILRYKGAVSASVSSLYTWGWTLGAVAIGFILIVFYCLEVIRRRFPRIALLALILVPFTVAAVMSETGGKWESQLTASLWGAQFWRSGISATGSIAMLLGSRQDVKNLAPSDDPKEEQWRMKLREEKRRQERVTAAMNSAKSASAAKTSVVAMVKSSSASSLKSKPTLSGTGDEIRNAGTMPGHLPTSGMDWTMIVSLLAVGYTATLHRRAQQRA